MNTQPEQILENNLVAQLEGMGYERVVLKDEADLEANLRVQLEKHNNTRLSDGEYVQVLNALSRGNIFERAKVLRDRVVYTKDNGERGSLELINRMHWCKNEFQVTQQLTMEGRYTNRYDVTILINGLPLVQIELKRRGLELKEAFNQINRYERHSYSAGRGLFHFVQLFVISNGVNTKYYANNALQARNFKQTFYWSDEKNRLITNLSEFTTTFLERCHLAKMITQYIVLNETQHMLMVLRPYQYYAVEAIIERVKAGRNPGYIWHTTGSGKTLTSFKAAQLITQIPKVEKVVFVVDRKDLDYQTSKEFNSFAKGSVDSTTDTSELVRQLKGTQKLIVTTIQKLNTAINKMHYANELAELKNKRVVFIFDECHRSQFGTTHDNIKRFFSKNQMFGFTGTPIMEENATTNEFGRRTTKSLFNERLHKYVITDAIRDENVLKFSVEYIRTFRMKESVIDIDVEEIDRPEVMNAPERMEKVVDYIIENHDRKTHNRSYTSIFCVGSVPALINYYHIFRDRINSGSCNLKIATIFTSGVNEEDQDAIGFTDEESELLSTAASKFELYKTEHTRDSLEGFIVDYNNTFGTNFTTREQNSFYNYYNDIAKRVKSREIDVLLVVNMFLTGFDSKHLNTLYVDKNLKHHGLIQAYSRTNRILDEKKSQGNIVCFRNLKQATDEAIKLFSNGNANEEIIMLPYEDYVASFDDAVERLMLIAPTVEDVSHLQDEESEFAFIQAFREIIRIKNILKTFTGFTHDDVEMSEQSFEDYKSKYLDLYDKVKSNRNSDKTSILNDIDFELELIHRDEINVNYILQLLAKMMEAPEVEKEKRKKDILDLIANETQLRSKRELIEKFIRENLPEIDDPDDVPAEFEKFWKDEQLAFFDSLCKDENLNSKLTSQLIEEIQYTEKPPLNDQIVAALNFKPTLLQRRKIAERVSDKLNSFIQLFVNGF